VFRKLTDDIVPQTGFLALIKAPEGIVNLSLLVQKLGNLSYVQRLVRGILDRSAAGFRRKIARIDLSVD
jgi:hypothetical protein